MKTRLALALFACLLTGCAVNGGGRYETTVGIGYERDGQRIDATATFRPLSGKQVAKTGK